MNFTQIDFNQAFIRHSMLKTRLRAFLLTGNGDTETLTNPLACSLGGWLAEIATKYALAANSVLEVTYLHEEAHNEAAKIIGLYRNNRLDEARTRLSNIESKDAQIQLALQALQKDIAA